MITCGDSYEIAFERNQCSWTTMDPNGDKTKAKSPSQIFCERVTVAGLDDLYTAKFPLTRCLFVVGLVMATMFGLFTSYRTVQESLKETSSVNIQFKDAGDMLFPNVTICTSTVINVTATREVLVVPKKVEDKLKEIGADHETFIQDVLEFATMAIIARQANQSHLRYIDAVYTATAATMNNGGRSIFDIVRQIMPPCNLTLSNCTYDGTPMDCCNGTVLGATDDYVCYGVPLATISRQPKPFSRPIVFNVDVRMDWAHIPWVRGEDALDGFLVIVSQPYTTMNTAPVAVAPGWHGTIKLTRIRQRTDRTDCIPRNKLPKMNYTGYYDQDGKNCELELALDMLRSGLQCTPPVATYIPNSTEGCNFRQTYVMRQFASGAMNDFAVNGLLEHNFTTIAEICPSIRADSYRAISLSPKVYHDKVGSMTQRCKPICERWQYEPIVGYSELRDSHGLTTDTNANISWSRITVSIPSEYYEEHMEEDRSALYSTMCNVGGAMGVCLGLSAVTLIQVVVYGLESCYTYKRNRNRVHPS